MNFRRISASLSFFIIREMTDHADLINCAIPTSLFLFTVVCKSTIPT